MVKMVINLRLMCCRSLKVSLTSCRYRDPRANFSSSVSSLIEAAVPEDANPGLPVLYPVFTAPGARVVNIPDDEDDKPVFPPPEIELAGSETIFRGSNDEAYLGSMDLGLLSHALVTEDVVDVLLLGAEGGGAHTRFLMRILGIGGETSDSLAAEHAGPRSSMVRWRNSGISSLCVYMSYVCVCVFTDVVLNLT
jgi:hypothetical protein